MRVFKLSLLFAFVAIAACFEETPTNFPSDYLTEEADAVLAPALHVPAAFVDPTEQGALDRVGGARIIEGDTLLTKRQLTIIKRLQSQHVIFDLKRQLWRKLQRESLWPGGRVYFKWHPEIQSSSRAALMKAMRHYEEVTCLRFIHGNPIRTGATAYVFKDDESGCWSNLGNQPLWNKTWGEPNLNLGPGCRSFRTAAHEIGHMVGLFNEEHRMDRDNYITIERKHVENSHQQDFKKFVLPSPMKRYDVGSLMHLGQYAFSKQAGVSKTIKVKSPHWRGRITGGGGPWGEGLSNLDRQALWRMYSCKRTTFPEVVQPPMRRTKYTIPKDCKCRTDTTPNCLRAQTPGSCLAVEPCSGSRDIKWGRHTLHVVSCTGIHKPKLLSSTAGAKEKVYKKKFLKHEAAKASLWLMNKAEREKVFKAKAARKERKQAVYDSVIAALRKRREKLFKVKVARKKRKEAAHKADVAAYKKRQEKVFKAKAARKAEYNSAIAALRKRREKLFKAEVARKKHKEAAFKADVAAYKKLRGKAFKANLAKAARKERKQAIYNSVIAALRKRREKLFKAKAARKKRKEAAYKADVAVYKKLREKVFKAEAARKKRREKVFKAKADHKKRKSAISGQGYGYGYWSGSFDKTYGSGSFDKTRKAKATSKAARKPSEAVKAPHIKKKSKHARAADHKAKKENASSKKHEKNKKKAKKSPKRVVRATSKEKTSSKKHEKNKKKAKKSPKRMVRATEVLSFNLVLDVKAKDFERKRQALLTDLVRRLKLAPDDHINAALTSQEKESFDVDDILAQEQQAASKVTIHIKESATAKTKPAATKTAEATASGIENRLAALVKNQGGTGTLGGIKMPSQPTPKVRATVSSKTIKQHSGAATHHSATFTTVALLLGALARCLATQ